MTTMRKTTPQTNTLAQVNIAFMRQGLDFLANLNDAEYIQNYQPALSDGIGSHVRHIVDHYRCFFEGLESGCVDYEDRNRNSTISTDRAAATDALSDIIERLQILSDQEHSLDVYVEQQSTENDPTRRRARSSVYRELQFLMSHTVHHYALLAVITRLAGRELIAGFGVSPSTLRYRETLR